MTKRSSLLLFVGAALALCGLAAGCTQRCLHGECDWRSTYLQAGLPAQGLASFNHRQSASFFPTIAQPLPTGGVAGITFSTDYQYLSNPPLGEFSVLNPSYVPRLTFGFEQPLLRGYGVEMNQLLGS